MNSRDLPDEQAVAALRGQTDHAETIRVAPDDIERLGPDRTGRSEDGHVRA